MNRRIKNSKDKIVGTMKETTCRIFDKDELEFWGAEESLSMVRNAKYK